MVCQLLLRSPFEADLASMHALHVSNMGLCTQSHVYLYAQHVCAWLLTCGEFILICHDGWSKGVQHGAVPGLGPSIVLDGSQACCSALPPPLTCLLLLQCSCSAHTAHHDWQNRPPCSEGVSLSASAMLPLIQQCSVCLSCRFAPPLLP